MKTEIVYILDRSGSMGDIWTDAFNGLNSFITNQKKIDGDCKFSLVLFDDRYEKPIDAQDLQTVQPVSSVVAFPRGTTAYLDALGKTINEVGERLSNTPEHDRPEKVIVVVMTDGYENASHEFNRNQIKEMIRHQEDKYSWEFIFMGADMDAVSEGATLGLKSINTINIDKSARGIATATAYSTNTVADYRTKK